MTIETSKFDYTHLFTLGDEEFHVRSMIPYVEKEQMA